MKGLYKELKKELKAVGLNCTSKDLAEIIGISIDSLKFKMSNPGRWSLTEAYKILSIIRKPFWQMPIYFSPKDVGITEFNKALLEIPQWDNTYEVGSAIIDLVKEIAARK